VKIAKRPNGEITVAPEYDDCARVALSKNIPLSKMMAEASRVAENKIKNQKPEI